MGRSLKWAYGVTTVIGRIDTYLPLTLASLYKGGFPDPHLFLDGSYPRPLIEKYPHLAVTGRPTQVRTAGHWVLSMLELYYLHPEYDRYTIFQDDMICCKGLREYLDHSPYPDKSYLNLYTFPSNQSLPEAKGVGWFRARNLNSGPDNYQTGRGAVALVFSNEALTALFSIPHLFTRAKDAHRGHRCIDGGVVTAMNQAGWSEYCHNPSLVQHIGDQSSIGNMPHPKAVSFPGEDYDAVELLDVPSRVRPYRGPKAGR